MVMKLILKERKLNEVKGTEQFRYDKAFIDSLNKPGKVAFVRFSNETGEKTDTVLFGTNFKGYAYSHTPTGIYGYPLNVPQVLGALRTQELYFSNADVIVVYWVDESTVFNLSTDMDQAKFKQLIQSLKDLRGEEFITVGLEKAKVKEKKRLDSMDHPWRVPRNMFDNLNMDAITDPKEMSKIFWNIITLGSKNSKDMTLLLYKLGFKTITDESAIIDIAGGEQAKSQAPIQSLTLNRAFIDGYKIYTNPARLRQSSRTPRSNWKSPDPGKTESESIKRFMQGMEEYKKQLPRLASTIDDKMTVEHVSGRRFKMTVRMPTTIRSSPRFKPEKKQDEMAAYNLLDSLKWADGRRYGTSNSGMDFYTSKLIMQPRKPDMLEVEFDIPPGLIDNYRPYKFLGFMYKYFTSSECPMIDKKSYLYMVTA